MSAGAHPQPSVSGSAATSAGDGRSSTSGMAISTSRDLVDWRPVGTSSPRGSWNWTAARPGRHVRPHLAVPQRRFYLCARGRARTSSSRRPSGRRVVGPHGARRAASTPPCAFPDRRVAPRETSTRQRPDHPFTIPGRACACRPPAALRFSVRPRVIGRGRVLIWPEAPRTSTAAEGHCSSSPRGRGELRALGAGVARRRQAGQARSRRRLRAARWSPHRGGRDPVQAVGHADLVDLNNGSAWAVLLGVRRHRRAAGGITWGARPFLGHGHLGRRRAGRGSGTHRAHRPRTSRPSSATISTRRVSARNGCRSGTRSGEAARSANGPGGSASGGRPPRCATPRR